MATAPPHSWQCPSCGRRVPLRADACHCGMTRARGEQLAAAQQAVPAVPRPTRGLSDRQAAVNAMTREVKILLGVGALVIVAGLGWMVFGPAPSRVTPVLGYVDPGPPRSPKAKDHLRPPFKLPWWK